MYLSISSFTSKFNHEALIYGIFGTSSKNPSEASEISIKIIAENNGDCFGRKRKLKTSKLKKL